MQGTPTAVPPAENVGEALRASLAGALNTLLAAIPRLLGFGLVLVVGWIISSLLARAMTALLHAVRFNDLADRSGFAGFVQRMGVHTDPVGVIAAVTKWFVRLIALVVAFDLLGLPAVSTVLQRLLLWLPNLVVGLVVLVIGGLAANAISRVVRGATADSGLANPDVLATVAKVSVWAFAIVVALSQLGIATALIHTLVVGVVGALALASGLAFGLGGRYRAAELLDRLGRGVEVSGPRLAAATRIAPAGLDDEVDVPRRPSGWRPRSGVDRRRLPRSGTDRRTALDSA